MKGLKKESVHDRIGSLFSRLSLAPGQEARPNLLHLFLFIICKTDGLIFAYFSFKKKLHEGGGWLKILERA